MKITFTAFLFLIALMSAANAQSNIIGQPIPGVSSTVAEGSRIFKATTGVLYGYQATSGGSAGYLLIFNSATVPADGTVTPAECYVIAANSTISGTFTDPLPMSNGIVFVFSTTGCFTKAVSATAFLAAQVM